ncbi:MAG: hypothetical protein ABW321_29735 [Polyangiales bacterium]
MTKAASAEPWWSRVLRFYLQLDHGAVRAIAFVRNALGAGLSHALTPQEKDELTRRLYDALPFATGRGDRLLPWEEVWYRQQLPAAATDILLGGAGTGREVHWLRAHGHRVAAFDIAPSSLGLLRAAVGDDRDALIGSYAELVAAVRGEPSPLSGLAERRFGAVILGLGSFSHVLGVPAQRELLQAANTLCPQGPILASCFFTVDEAPRDPPPRSRAADTGRYIGRHFARWRGLTPQDFEEQLLPRTGFVHISTPRELSALAASVDRRIQLEPDSFVHVTFVR